MGKSVASRFENISIEKSVLLGVIADDDELMLEVDFCLQPAHPSYETPGADEVECFHPGTLRFAGISNLEIERSDASTGEALQRRFAIHSFTIDGSRFAMTCDWGAIQLQARSIRVVIE